MSNTVVEEREQYLIDEMGKEWVENLFGSAKEKQEFLMRVGAESKAIEKEEDPADEDAPENAKAKKPAAKKKEAEPVLKEQMGALIKAIAGELQLDDLSEYIEDMEKRNIVLEAKVKSLMKDEDEKLAERISPDAKKHHYAWDKRKSQAKSTVLDEDDADEETKELLKAEPKPFVKIASVGIDPE